jgi:hypothetical protein
VLAGFLLREIALARPRAKTSPHTRQR